MALQDWGTRHHFTWRYPKLEHGSGQEKTWVSCSPPSHRCSSLGTAQKRALGGYLRGRGVMEVEGSLQDQEVKLYP